ncbi:MAG: replication-associated recombination protein A [Bacteriovoracaceae bacterium]|nr:replication-associated recombination protein A [Bacteriovoracaceae bacterium]
MVDDGQMGLFDNKEPSCVKNSNKQSTPLAYLARPSTFDEFIGQAHIFRRYPFLKKKNFPSIIFWGPPGTGKTTLAYIMAQNCNKDIYKFNAVLGGVNELRKLINSAVEVKQKYGTESIIFIDEIHRFNKAQQDALLPYVEAGSFTLIGATTENPRSSVNRALISRVQTIELKKLEEADILSILKNVVSKFEVCIPEEVVVFIADLSNGDARLGLNVLDIVKSLAKETATNLTPKQIKNLILENCRDFDRNKDRHYDVISAFIKSMRGSDPQAAILWLAVMLDGGEDPVFIARRLVVFASEDVGNADPMALNVATATLLAVSKIGMPEARINLAQATTYLASTVKSNASYMAINKALEYVQNQQTIEVPDHLKNYPPKDFTGKYLYPHNYPEHFVKQKYTKGDIPQFYKPDGVGREENIHKRLEALWANAGDAQDKN